MINEMLDKFQMMIGAYAHETPFDPNKDYTVDAETKKLMKKHGTDILISDANSPDIGYFMRGGKNIKLALPPGAR